MKLLFDANISFRIVKKINHKFKESKHVSDIGLLKATDLQIWKYAKKNGYIITTNDADFNEISTINNHPPKIIWLRLGNTSTTNIAKILLNKEKEIKQFIKNNEFGIMEIRDEI